MNPLIRLVLFVGGIACLFAFGVHDHLKLMDCQSDLAKTVNSLELTTSNLNQCLDVREHDQALTRQAISDAKECQRLLHEQMQAKDEPVLDETVKWMTNLPTPLVLTITNKPNLVSLWQNGTNILTVDPNFNVLVHGVKIGRITETNWSPEP